MALETLRFPEVPTEILLEILKATRKDRPTLLALTRVSSWVREVVLPLLIETITLTTGSQVSAFQKIIPLRTTDWWAKHLKNIWITYPDPTRTCSKIFALPRYPEVVALQSSILHWQGDPDYLLAPLLQGCSDLTLIGPTFPYNFDHASQMFANVARLHLTSPLSGPVYTGCKLAELPKLTHIALPFQQPRGYARDDFEEIKHVLKSSSLEMVVLNMKLKSWSKNCSGMSELHRSLEEWRLTAYKYDSRLHIVEENGGLNHKEWEYVVRGGDSLWERVTREHQIHGRGH